MKRKREAGYNERLFEGGFRRRFHLARFEWAGKALRRANATCESVLELGCFDGRVIPYLPRRPAHYLGLDANWENGLTVAKEQFAETDFFEFHECRTPDDLRSAVGTRRFDTAVCLETLEHVEPRLVEEYILALSEVVAGVIVITVPNEKGFIFLSKHLAKLAWGDPYSYTFKEVLSAAAGQMSRVSRNQHKGFDYQTVVTNVRAYFDVLEVSGYPFRFLPQSAGFGVGILARSRSQRAACGNA